MRKLLSKIDWAGVTATTLVMGAMAAMFHPGANGRDILAGSLFFAAGVVFAKSE